MSARDRTATIAPAPEADSSPPTEALAPAPAPVREAAAPDAEAEPLAPTEPVRGEENNEPVDDNGALDLGRMAWFATVLASVIAVAVLLSGGYYGYAGVTFAVAAAAAINLF